MKQVITAMFFVLLTTSGLFAQNIVKGVVTDIDSEKPLQGVSVSVKGTENVSITDSDGIFTLQNVPDGKQIVIVQKQGYETQNFPISMLNQEVDLGTIAMYEDEFAEEEDLSTIVISDDELNDDTSGADNISGLLQASRDVYSRTAAFEWSPSFYRIRGLDSENGKVLINGIEMNKLYNGRPQWGNWGGLNDVLRNQEFSNGLAPSGYTFGGVLGSTNISTRASEYRSGIRVSYASSNRSYQHRGMVTYTTGLLDDGWAFAFSASRRLGNEGYVEGTSYNAYSMFGSLEKIINDKHSINFTSIYAFNRRGKSAAHTQEIYDLKGTKYNEYWGYQEGKIRNARLKRIEEPIVMLSHYWNLADNTSVNTNISYQFGEIGNSRIDFNEGKNPSAAYYQNLPSYWLDKDDLAEAYEKEQAFLNYGQVDWKSIYDANITNNRGSLNAAYVFYEDRNDDKQFTVNTILDSQLNDNITLNAKLQYSKLDSENFAEVIDMLGGTGYLDINRYANINSDERQSNLLTPNRVVSEGDRFKYNYNLESRVTNAFIQGQFKYNKVDFYLSGDVSQTTHQREGLYQNGSFKNNSLGKSKKIEFTNVSGKAGFTYKITGRHLLDFNGGYIAKAPPIRNIFSSSRENNAVVLNLQSEKIISADASYIFRSPMVQGKITGYYTAVQDATDISFYFLQGTLDSFFVQEVLTGLNKLHFGTEFGLEVQAMPTLKVRAAANIGQYTYANNPDVYIASADLAASGNEFGVNEIGKSYLKNYRVAAGPQKAYSIGFEYRDPSYWWFGASGNYLSDIYIDISPITRSDNFYKDVDGLPITNYDPDIARKLLQQEKFDDYFTVNAVGGKSWKVGNRKYIGFFASISNILGKIYKTGGYEQSRRADYQQLLEESQREKRLFGNKYWYGRGTTYFLNINYRF